MPHAADHDLRVAPFPGGARYPPAGGRHRPISPASSRAAQRWPASRCRWRPGRTVALLGPNGAGKTTLLRILATAIRPSYGRVEVDGLDLGRDAALVRERVAYLSHATGLYDDLTARENLGSRRRCSGRPTPHPGWSVRSPTSGCSSAPAIESAGSRRACGSGWRSRASCSAARPSSCSTSRTPPSTPRAWAWSISCSPRGAKSASPSSSRRTPSSEWPVARCAHGARRGLVAEVGEGARASRRRSQLRPAQRRRRSCDERVPRRGARRTRHRAQGRGGRARGRHAIVSTLFFAAVVLLLFGFALGPDRRGWPMPRPACCGWRSSSRDHRRQPPPPPRDR